MTITRYPGPGANTNRGGRVLSRANSSKSNFGLSNFRLQFNWASTISSKEWALYQQAIKALKASGVQFMLGGGFALATFTGHWRDTKDIDFYVLPRDRKKAVAALEEAGFVDYYSKLAYDRRWIHRNTKSNVLVDIIWSMANRRAAVDELWFELAGAVTIRGEELAVVPMEEFLWCKLYIIQRDHCDWTDSLNLIYARGNQIDWNHLIRRVGDDLPLLSALLSVYGWLCPARALELPSGLWARLRLPIPEIAPGVERERIGWLDSRAWFGALQPKNVKLDV